MPEIELDMILEMIQVTTVPVPQGKPYINKYMLPQRSLGAFKTPQESKQTQEQGPAIQTPVQSYRANILGRVWALNDLGALG